MDIDITALRNGEKVICPTCGKGFFIQTHMQVPIKDESLFDCSNCGERLHINFDRGWKKVMREILNNKEDS